jgi:hypothetical protein
MGVSDQRHAPAAFYAWENERQYPLDRRLEKKSFAAAGDKILEVYSV